jgi:hypothetical protein
MSEEKNKNPLKKFINGMMASSKEIISNFIISKDKASELATQALEATTTSNDVVAVDTKLKRVITSSDSVQSHFPLNTIEITEQDRSNYKNDPETATEELAARLQKNACNVLMQSLCIEYPFIINPKKQSITKTR